MNRPNTCTNLIKAINRIAGPERDALRLGRTTLSTFSSCAGIRRLTLPKQGRSALGFLTIGVGSPGRRPWRKVRHGIPFTKMRGMGLTFSRPATRRSHGQMT